MPEITPVEEAERFILEATQRAEISDAVAWIGEEHPLIPGIDWSRLLRALVAVVDQSDTASRAIRRAVRQATASRVDTSKVIFDYESLHKPADYRSALDELLARSADGTLEGLNPRDLIRAQYANPLAIETFCLSVGVTHSDAKDWFGVGAGGWSQAQAAQLLEYIHRVLCGAEQSPIPGSVTSRAVELLEDGRDSWARIHAYISGGVPYEILLSQRSVGGVWLAHKNATSSYPNIAAADALARGLRQRGVDFRRASTVGGDARQRDLQHLSGVAKKQVGLVALAEGGAKFAVAFSSARDGGTARANGDGLMQIPVTDLPFALMLTGLGWAGRPETDRLARRFSGLLFTEQTVSSLVNCIAEATG